MRGLRSLQLIHNDLTNQGLAAILDKCVHLESLCIHYCWNICMTRKIKARIKKKKLLMNYMHVTHMDCDENNIGEDFHPRSLNIECSTCLDYFGRGKESYPKHILCQ